MYCKLTKAAYFFLFFPFILLLFYFLISLQLSPLCIQFAFLWCVLFFYAIDHVQEIQMIITALISIAAFILPGIAYTCEFGADTFIILSTLYCYFLLFFSLDFKKHFVLVLFFFCTIVYFCCGFFTHSRARF